MVKDENEIAIPLNDEFEQLKKEKGYGHFTYDEKGKLTGVAMKAPDALVPTHDEVV